MEHRSSLLEAPGLPADRDSLAALTEATGMVVEAGPGGIDVIVPTDSK